MVQELSTIPNSLALDRTFYKYNYLGQPVQKQIHSTDDCNLPSNYTETYVYGYDGGGRMNSKTYKLNNEAALNFVYTYDNLCRLNTKQLSGSETTTYSYNVRSWLTGLTGNKFSENIYYNQPNSG